MAPTEPGNPMRSDDTGSSEPRAASSRTAALVWVVLLVVVAVAAWALWRFLPHASAPKPEQAAARPNATVEEPDLPGRALIRKSAEPNQAPYSGLDQPRGASVDGDGRLWVADFGTSRVHLFDPNGGDLGGWGGFGNAQRRFSHPYAVAVSADTVYVADTENSRVTAFSLQGDWKASSGGLYGPRGIAIAPDGQIWVTDMGNRRLMRYDPGLTRFDSFGKGEKGIDFRAPIGITVAADGIVYVSDPDDHSLKVFDAQGNPKARWPIATWGPNSEPYLINGPNNTLIATDPLKNAVFMLDRSGKETHRWTTDSRNAAFSNPTGIAMDPKTHLVYVVNTGTNSVTRIDLSPKK
ncbi:MAG TPA: NHL repeat-containing protein [Thermoanaerobaculia bacterium]